MIILIRNNGYIDDNVSNDVSRWEHSTNDDNNNNINYSHDNQDDGIDDNDYDVELMMLDSNHPLSSTIV